MKELTLKELQDVNTELLKEIHNFCVSNNIKYSIAYGTLLGAVRHKNFIPWDDDIDVMMIRPEYERFCKEFISDNSKLIYYGNDKTSLAGFARVVDIKKTIFLDECPWTKQKVGVGIDIFPIDGVENEKQHYAQRYNYLKKICKFIYRFRRQNHHIVKGDSLSSILKTIFVRIISLNGFIPHLLINKMVKDEQKIDFDSAIYLGQCSYLDDGPILFSKKDFKDYILLDFGKYNFYAISGFDNFLKQVYGDYMQIPPKDMRKPKQLVWTKYYWKE